MSLAIEFLPTSSVSTPSFGIVVAVEECIGVEATFRPLSGNSRTSEHSEHICSS